MCVFPVGVYDLALLTFQYSGEQLKQLAESEEGCRCISPLIWRSLGVRDMSRGLAGVALRRSQSLRVRKSGLDPVGVEQGWAITLQILCKGYVILSAQESHSGMNVSN